MAALFYLPVTSPLVCASTDHILLRAWATGHAQALVDAAEHASLAATDPVEAALRMQTCADMCLLQGRCEESARLYRRSMRRLVEPRDIDTFSCRAAGYKALLHDRIEPAAACFQRLSVEGNSVAVRLEAMLVLALLFHRASLFAEAHADLNRMADLAIASGLAPWLRLAHIAGRHFALLARVHACSEFDGHVEWRAASASTDGIQRLARLPRQSSNVPEDDDTARLLAQREQHVAQLDLLSDRSLRDSDACIGPLAVRTWGRAEPELTGPQALIEMAMAALSARRERLAGLLLEPVLRDHPLPEVLEAQAAAQLRAARRNRSRSRPKRAVRPAVPLPPAAPWPPLQWPLVAQLPSNRSHRPSSNDDVLWNDAPRLDARAVLRPLAVKPIEQDYLYAVSRLRVQQGRNDEGARHYRAYLARALRGLGKLGTSLRRSIEPRADVNGRPAQRPKSPTAPPVPERPADDVTRRLPARYIEAYRFMLDNLSRADLSMREVAERANTTERSLQMAFKRHLGESPREVLRRRRMEKIHSELLLHPHSHDGVMEVAMRHGVTNRAALLSGYRKYYAETPSDSLAEALRLAARREPEPTPGPVISHADVSGSSP